LQITTVSPWFAFWLEIPGLTGKHPSGRPLAPLGFDV